MFPVTGFFGQTARLFHTPEFAELREAMEGAEGRARASEPAPAPTVPPQAAYPQEVA